MTLSFDLRALLEESAAGMGVEITDEACLGLLKYLILLRKWNAKINLTGTRDDREIVSRHLLDSLAVVPFIPRDAGRLIDVGSGAGLPGAVIGIFRRELEVTALEPIHKKYAFLAALRRELPLPNLRAFPKRVEDYRASPDFTPFDAAVSRATWPLDEWLECGKTLVRPGGLVIGMEGADARDLPARAERHPYRIEDRTRAVITWPQ